MCGIYGEISTTIDTEPRSSFARTAGEALHHRGPDGSGVWSDECCLLGHARLAIIDLSDHASQPMTSASGRSHMVFNGEIYNYVELRSAHPAPAGGWRSASDSEVLLELLDRNGIAALDSAVGMFAIAVWRPAERELWLIRDRLGKKPLYYARTPSGGLRFASEPGALLADGAIPRSTSMDRLAEYLQHGYVAAPRTAFREIHVVPPGSMLRASLTSDGIAMFTTRYWQLPAPAGSTGTAAAWREEFAATLDDAVRIRLRSDVPLGAFLSGGVDSSVVSLLASRRLSSPLRTFTVDFAEPRFSEGAYASEVARSLGTDHTEITLDPASVMDLPRLVATYGDLHGDSSALPTFALCRETRRHVTVALSGDGGDELLGGYHRYAGTLNDLERARRIPVSILHGIQNTARHALPWWTRGAARLGRMTRDLDASYVREMWSYSPRIWPPVLAPEARRPWPDVVAGALAAHRQRPPLLRLMACDDDTYLPEDILVKVDRASMAHGLEVRAPLLDHRLMELVMRASPAWIADGNGGKLPLRTLFGTQLPSNVFSRAKMGFGVPLNAWFRGRMRRYASERLLDPRATVAPVLDRRAIRRLLWSHGIGQRDESNRIWHLLVLHAWFDLWRPGVVGASGT